MSSTLLEQRRDLRFDVLKGILILLVLLGHALQYCYGEKCWQNTWFSIIYHFHMPLFVMISGYFFSSSLNRDIKDVLVRKTRRLLYPLFFWSTIVLFISLLSDEFRLSIFSSVLICLKEVYLVYTRDWFLICIFILSIGYWLFFNGNRFVRVSLFILWIISIIYFDNIPSFLLKNCQISRMALVFGLGAYCSQNKNVVASINKPPRIRNYLLLLFVCLLFVLIDAFNWGTNLSLFSEPERIIDGLFCSVFVFLILFPCCRYLSGCRIGKFLIYCGRNSLGLYVIHMVFTRVFSLFRPLPDNAPFSVVLVFVFYLLASILVIELLGKSKKFTLLIGR